MINKDIVLRLSEIAVMTNAQLDANYDDCIIKGVASLENANAQHITFFNGDTFYKDSLQSSKAVACFVESKYVKQLPNRMIPLVVQSAYLAIAKVLQHCYAQDIETYDKAINADDELKNGYFNVHQSVTIGEGSVIAKSAVIHSNVVIGSNVFIGDNVVIYPDVIIGNNSVINANVIIKHAWIGCNCIIHHGAVIGKEGFGYVANEQQLPMHIVHIGKVKIGNFVTIGSNCCIDRSVLNTNIVGDYTKLDNLVHLGHNVVVGKGCFIAASAVVAGGAVIEDFVSVAGLSAIGPNVILRQGTKIAGMSGVHKSTLPNSVMIGVPAMNFYKFWKLQAMIKKMFNE